MRKIKSFNFITLNGYFKGSNEDISWHVHGEEGNSFSEDQLQAQNVLLFGRRTFEMMRDFWTSPLAYDQYPVVAEKMNSSEKIVITNSLEQSDWQNTLIFKGNLIEILKNYKSTPGSDITILGSGSIVSQLTEAGLIDTYQFLIDPLVISDGIGLFDQLKKQMDLHLVDCKIFKKSGQVLLTYHRPE